MRKRRRGELCSTKRGGDCTSNTERGGRSSEVSRFCGGIEVFTGQNIADLWHSVNEIYKCQDIAILRTCPS